MILHFSRNGRQAGMAVELKEMITQHKVYAHALNVLRSVEAQ